ncbi:MAG TPA: glycosyltransferase family 2 protein [Vicinamibacteria bacterium]|nr:glycosyltransferase family 2 protein [Vicinamibacteria bacterium]
MSGAGPSCLVVVPAFNEAAAIGAVLARIRQVDSSLPVVVVDDGSSDATAAAARAAGADVLRLPFNLGYGAALQTAYKYALRAGYGFVVQLDGDGQHEPADIPRLLEVVARGEADLAIGSRFAGMRSYVPSLPRRLGMRLFGLLASSLTGLRFSDVTSGFQALNRELLEFFVSERYPADFPDADVLIMLSRAGFRIREVPVTMYENRRGTSMHAGWRPLYYVFRMVLSIFLTTVRREHPRRKDA